MQPLLRCPWPLGDDLMLRYHDEEWGVPLHDDRKLFEFLVLESMQAGLSWRTVLHKREAFRAAFAGFDATKVARFGPRQVARLLADPGIIRNRAKIDAVINNAQRFLETQREFGSFDDYIWRFTDGKTLRAEPVVILTGAAPPGLLPPGRSATAGRAGSAGQVRATSPESDAMSADLKQRGFKFVGSTICYAHMQATGMVNDHVAPCFRAPQARSTRSRQRGT